MLLWNIRRVISLRICNKNHHEGKLKIYLEAKLLLCIYQINTTGNLAGGSF